MFFLFACVFFSHSVLSSLGHHTLVSKCLQLSQYLSDLCLNHKLKILLSLLDFERTSNNIFLWDIMLSIGMKLIPQLLLKDRNQRLLIKIKSNITIWYCSLCFYPQKLYLYTLIPIYLNFFLRNFRRNISDEDTSMKMP